MSPVSTMRDPSFRPPCEGAGFAAQGLAMTALIDETTGKQTFGIRQRRKKVLKDKIPGSGE
jgi:hypothetical protein